MAAAGAAMARGMVDAVVVGCDRVAANGDTANKVGTYSLAVLARQHGIPFWVAGPRSSFDLDTPDGAAIVVEERDPDEVRDRAGPPPRARRRAGVEPGLRHHPGRPHRGLHHRRRDRAPAVRAELRHRRSTLATAAGGASR